MAFGGPTASRGWFPSSGASAWSRAADFWNEMQASSDKKLAEAAELHVLGPIREAILSDPSINGTDNEDWNMAEEVAGAVRVYNTSYGVRIGVPGDDPAADSAVRMEYGDETQPPSPHFRNNFLGETILQAQQRFAESLVHP
jgi:hypothetical protein